MILRVHFEPPGFFLNDPRLSVRLAGRVLYDGNFKCGFDVTVNVPAGKHVLETEIHGPLGGSGVTQRIELSLDADGGYRDVPEVHAKLTYNRVRGNFHKRASLSVKQ